jgi:predicted ATP-grasp superfamily ATP-dependent carboligase
MDSQGAPDGDAVVVPAITPPSSLACLRSLGGRDVRTIAVSERETAAAFRSKYCDEAYVTPDPVDDLDGYADALLSLAERPDVRTILPVREHDALVLAKHRAAFGEHVGTPWPDWPTLRRVQDRLELYDVAESVDVAVPDTQLLSACTDFDRELIVKSRYTVPAREFDEGEPGRTAPRGGGTLYLPTGESPPESAIRFSMGHDPIVQAFMPGPSEYGFFAIYDRGEALATFQHRQLRGYKYCGGPSAYRESIHDPDLESAGRRLLDALEWHGVAMVEFKRDPETGEFLLMEVNPRFWSSLPFTVQAGADFPYYAWQLATGRADEIEHGYRVGVAGHLVRGELLYLHSVLTEEYPLVERPGFPSALWAVLSSIARQPRFDYLDRDDPGPFFQDLRNLVSDAVTPKQPALGGKPSFDAIAEYAGRLQGSEIEGSEGLRGKSD